MSSACAPAATLWSLSITRSLSGTFKDITKEAGLTRRGWGMGVAVADYDNDGKLDLFVTGFGGSALYHGLGNCKSRTSPKRPVSAASGLHDRRGLEAITTATALVDLYVSPATPIWT